jgi:SAM-dependent methyltransferase
MRGAKWYWDMLGTMLNSARTGEKGGMDFGYFEEHKHDADVANQAMTSGSAYEIGSILESYDFTGTNRLMDVGGGYGSLLAAVLAANPHMRGVLFDAPSVIEKAVLHMEATTVADRCELVGGDFFISVPCGADTVIMKHVIHDWNDENSLRILKSCHAALSAGGKLLIIESIIRPGNDPSPGKILDLVMLLIGGRERMEAEFLALLDHAGFDLTRIVATSSPVSVVEARKR